MRSPDESAQDWAAGAGAGQSSDDGGGHGGTGESGEAADNEPDDKRGQEDNGGVQGQERLLSGGLVRRTGCPATGSERPTSSQRREQAVTGESSDLQTACSALSQLSPSLQKSHAHHLLTGRGILAWVLLWRRCHRLRRRPRKGTWTGWLAPCAPQPIRVPHGEVSVIRGRGY